MGANDAVKALAVLAGLFGLTLVANKTAQALPGASWQALADKWIARYGAWRPIVYATVEAETDGLNVAGDGGNALGYGQVWPTWHMWAFAKAGADLGIAVRTDLEGLRAQVLDNPEFSMAVAVLVIDSFWTSTPGPVQGVGLESRWEAFTRRYVGPGIPEADLERRRRIWQKYKP